MNAPDFNEDKSYNRLGWFILDKCTLIYTYIQIDT